MAERKQFLEVPEPNSELLHLLELSRTKPVSEQVLREQRISFAFGNALNSDRVTKDSVRHASKHVKLFP